jgi:hypothetical protein
MEDDYDSCPTEPESGTSLSAQFRSVKTLLALSRGQRRTRGRLTEEVLRALCSDNHDDDDDNDSSTAPHSLCSRQLRDFMGEDTADALLKSYGGEVANKQTTGGCVTPTTSSPEPAGCSSGDCQPNEESTDWDSSTGHEEDDLISADEPPSKRSRKHQRCVTRYSDMWVFFKEEDGMLICELEPEACLGPAMMKYKSHPRRMCKQPGGSTGNMHKHVKKYSSFDSVLFPCHLQNVCCDNTFYLL